MELQYPFRVITPTVDGDVLQVVASAHTSFSIPQLDRLIEGRSLAGIRGAVARLVGQGIVVESGAGRGRRYGLNDGHLAAPAMRQIASAKSRLMDRTRELVARWSIAPVFGALFGSAARGTMGSESDLDLLVVRSDDADESIWLEQTAQLTQALTTWTGNDTRVIDVRVQEIRDESLHPLLDDVVRHGIPFTPDTEWLHRALRNEEPR